MSVIHAKIIEVFIFEVAAFFTVPLKDHQYINKVYRWAYSVVSVLPNLRKR